MKRKPTQAEWALCMLLDGKQLHDLIDNGGLPPEYHEFISDLRYSIEEETDVYKLDLEEVKGLKK